MDESRWLLEAISEEFEVISRHAEHIPRIETDILLENLRKLYENLRIIQRLDEPHISDEHKPVNLASAGEGAAVKNNQNPVLANPNPEKPSPAADNTSVPGIPTTPKPAGTAQVRRPEPQSPAKKPVKSQDIDLFAQDDPLQAVKLQDARERAFSPKIPGSRVDNLKMAIPINDKFMFINDLFDGNLREYNETIEALNGFKTLDQAAEYLDLMKRKNLWNTSSPAFLKLKDLLERRF